MLKIDFEKLIGRELTQNQFECIDRVYAYYPADLDMEDTADLWAMGGFGIFKDLQPTADRAMALVKRKNDLEKQIMNTEEEINALTERYDCDA